jgi:hypothetical protein
MLRGSYARLVRMSLHYVAQQWAAVGGLVRRFGFQGCCLVDRACLSSKPAKNIRERWQVVDASGYRCRCFRSLRAAMVFALACDWE